MNLNQTTGSINTLKLQGGEVSIADRANLKINNIHIESQQDTASSSNSSQGGSIGGGTTGNITASYNQGKGNSASAWVNNTSKLLIGDAEKDADLDAMGVKNITNIGGVIANASKQEDGILKDHGKLNYTGALELKDIQDHSTESNRGFNISTSIGKSVKGQDAESVKFPNGSTTVGLQSTGNEKEQLTKATMGQGSVTNTTTTSNRDINNTQEITRDQVTGMLDGSVTVDHRILTESGRAQIIQEQKDLPENFRQSVENLSQALPEGAFKEKVLQTLNNVQASLVKMPAEMKAGGEVLVEAYPEYIRRGGDPKDFERMINDPQILQLIKEANDLNTLKNQAVVELMDQGYTQENANQILKEVEQTELNSDKVSKSLIILPTLDTIRLLASKGIILPNADDSQARYGQEQLDIDKTSNLIVDAVTKTGQVKQKIDQKILESNIDPAQVGLALSLVLGGPANLAKSVVIDTLIGEKVEAVKEKLKTEATAGLLQTDAETVEQVLRNKEQIAREGNKTAQQLTDQLEWTKEGIGVVSNIVLGGTGVAATGKVIKNDKSNNDVAKQKETINENISTNSSSIETIVPDYVTRNDHDFSATESYKGKPKAYIDDKGDLVPPNIDGTGSIQSHIRGGNSENTPYISTTDPNFSQNSKDYGGQQIKINTQRLQEDIDAGKISGTKIITHTQIRQELQSKVDVAQVRFDTNPSKKNKDKLADAQKDLSHAIRDGECLIKGCVPSEYLKK